MERSINSIVVLLALLSGFASCGSDSAAPSSTTSGTSTGLPDISAVTNAGITVSSNKLISPYSTDLCTEYAGEECYFRGGQIVKFSDDSILITGGFSMLYTSGADTDTNENAVTMFVPSTVSLASSTISTLVARGAGPKRLFLAYDRTLDQLALIHDTNGSLSANSGDTTITTLSVTTW